MAAKPSDKIYEGYNFSQLGRELTVDNLWHSRSRGDIFKHMRTALIISCIPTFYDLFTDSFAAKKFIQGTNYTKFVNNLSDPAFHEHCIHVGRFTSFHPEPEIVYEEISCFEKDPIWGAVTVLLILLPGVNFASVVSRIISEVMQSKSPISGVALLLLLLIPAMLMFPLILILVKLVGLVNPGPEWKKITTGITSMEGEWESALQLLLTLFIIFTRADRRPAWWQYASLIASLVLVTKTSIARHLLGKQMSTKDEVKTTASLLLLFLSNGVFKIFSLAISLALLRHWGFLVSFGFPVAFLGCIGCSKWRHLRAGCFGHLTQLHFQIGFIKTDKQRLENCVFNNIVWISVHTLVLTGMVIFANWFPDTYVYNWDDLFGQSEDNSDTTTKTTLSLINSTVDPSKATFFTTITEDSESLGETVLHSFFAGYKLSSRALVQNLQLLNGLFAGILCTMALHVGLFYFQTWKPFQEKEEEEKEKKEGEGKEEKEGLINDASPFTFSPTLRGKSKSGGGEGDNVVNLCPTIIA